MGVVQVRSLVRERRSCMHIVWLKKLFLIINVKKRKESLLGPFPEFIFKSSKAEEVGELIVQFTAGCVCERSTLARELLGLAWR